MVEVSSRTLALYVCLLLQAFSLPIWAQEGCNANYIRVFGSLIERERGYSLAGSLDEQSFYVGGIKGDSAVILKVKTSGEVAWTRTFDVVPGKQDHIFRVLVDSDGMIGVSGIAGTQQAGGTIFIFRYDPETNEVLWTKELISTSTNYNLGMIEIGAGGNYLVSNNPASPNNAELVEINKETGEVVPSFSKHYHLGTSETVYDLVYHEGYLYGSGRFSDGGSIAEMRNAILKIDPDDGGVDWMKLGHKPAHQQARLYGLDITVAEGDLFSIYVGDESGTSIDFTKVFIQRTTTDGELVWLKRYELPGSNDWADEIVHSNGGLVVLARNRVSPSDFILFKIGYNGDVNWARKFDYTNNDNAVGIGSIQSQLIEVDNHYYFTAFAEEGSEVDMILVRTDLNGSISDSCALSTNVNISVSNVNNPIFYEQSPVISNYIPQLISHSLESGVGTSLQTTLVCGSPSAIDSHVDAIICSGDTLEGYIHSGFYIDTFINQDGCDSLRYLSLIVTDLVQSAFDIEICIGQEYEGYSESGVYQDTFLSSHGCDSLRVLNLTVGIPEKHVEYVICSGNSFEGYTQSGMYIDTIHSTTNQCDTVQYLNLLVAPPIQSTFHETVCNGSDYFGYTSPGVYIDSFSTSSGCDSIRTVSLGVIDPSETVVNTTLCEAYQFGHYTAGVFIDTLNSINGCDSIRILNIQGNAVYIPNVFSPNGDLINDIFSISIYPENIMELVSFSVFDRWGDLVHQIESYPVEWDGRGHSGRFLNPGVYTYLLIFRCQNQDVRYTGDITLIR